MVCMRGQESRTLAQLPGNLVGSFGVRVCVCLCLNIQWLLSYIQLRRGSWLFLDKPSQANFLGSISRLLVTGLPW